MDMKSKKRKFNSAVFEFTRKNHLEIYGGRVGDQLYIVQGKSKLRQLKEWLSNYIENEG